MRPLTARERRLVAIALLVAAIVVFYLGLAAPLWRGFADRGVERERLLDEISVSGHLIDQAEFWRAQAARQKTDADAFAMAAPTREAAVEAATQRIDGAVVSQGAVVKTIREQTGGAGLIRVRVDLEASLTAFVASLKLLENQKPYVLVEKLSISADQAATAGRLSPMEISIDLAVPYRVVAG
jgi:general secretion pathway protein M